MFVHNIDPIIASIGGVHLWWYGSSYSLGFFNAHLFLRRNRERLGLSLRSVYDLTLCLCLGVLVGGRSLVVFNNEWSFYREHLSLIPAIWLGGLATHGLLLGGALGVFVFCLISRRPFRPIFDALAIPAALILGCGRIGNFIDGQIVGSVTSVPWAVKFPEVDGFRHPVVLYDGLKNFALIPLLLWVRRRGAPPGRLAALFVFLYPALRIPIDLLREYPITLFGLPTGQTFNIAMTILGAALLLRNWLRRDTLEDLAPIDDTVSSPVALHWRPMAFAVLLLVALVIPSDATRDVPVLYSKRHPGLTHSPMYPSLDLREPIALPENPCELMTAHEMALASGLDVVEARRVPDIQEIVRAQHEGRAPSPGTICSYETRSSVGAIMIAVLTAVQQTTAHYQQRLDRQRQHPGGSVQILDDLGLHAWTSGGVSVSVLVREHAHFSVSTQMYQPRSRDVVIAVARAVLRQLAKPPMYPAAQEEPRRSVP